MIKSYIIKKEDDIEFEKSEAFFAEIFDSVYYKSGWFKWKHYQNPYGASIIACSYDTEKNRIAAMRAFWRHRFFFNGEIVNGFQPCDTATHPDYQRQGLFTLLTQYAIEESRKENTHFIFNFPSYNSKPGYLKMGWNDLGGMTMLIRPLNAQFFPKAIDYFLKNKIVKNETVIHPSVTTKYLLNSKQLLKYPYCMGRYPQNTSKLVPYVTAPYLHWRLLKNPLHKYYGISVKDSLIVFRLKRRGTLIEVSLIEVLSVTPDVQANFKKFFKVIKKEFLCDFISFLSTVGHPFHRLLKANGFFSVPTRSNFVVLPQLINPQNHGGVQISPIDVDTF